MFTKLFSKFAAVVACAVSLISCSWSEMDESMLDCNVSITIAEPSSGKTLDVPVDRVRYFVYEQTGKTWTLRPDMEGSTSINSDGTAHISLPFVHETLYSVVFWADCAPEAGQDERFILDAANATVTMNTENLSVNDPKSDAFFAVSPVRGGVPGMSVVLWHALAKVNVMTSELPQSAANCSLSLSNVPTTFNFMDYDVTSVRSDLEFASASCLNQPELVDGMETMAYAYVFAPAEKMKNASLDFVLNGSDNSTIYSTSLDHVSLQRNRKTDVECKIN